VISLNDNTIKNNEKFRYLGSQSDTLGAGGTLVCKSLRTAGDLQFVLYRL